MANDKPTTNGNGVPHVEDQQHQRFTDATLNAALDRLTNNILAGRQAWLNRMSTSLDPRRNIFDECGYPKTSSLDAYKLQDLYDREPIAGRVVEVMPKQSWQVQPRVYELEKSDEPTEFEKAWDGLAKQLRGRSFFKSEEGSPVWEYLLRGDILSGIGHYGVIFIGLNDGVRDLSLPAKGVEEENSEPTELPKEQHDAFVERGVAPPAMRVIDPPTKNGRYSLTTNVEEMKDRKITMLRAIPETQCQVVQWEQNPTSPRYGQPVMYLMYFADPNSSDTSTFGQPMAGRMVHWTRCIHIADRYHHASSNECVATPRIQPVLNPILDIMKVRGAGAEGYWKMAFSLLSFETNPQLGPDPEIDDTAMKDLIERLGNGLTKDFYTSGFQAKLLAPTINDPTPHITVNTEAICVKLEIPIRVFKGSERGELASSQDDQAWNDRVQARQLYYITPWIIIPFIDRLIMLGVLPEPTEIEEKEVVDEEAQKKLDEQGQPVEGDEAAPEEGDGEESIGPLAKPPMGKRPVPFGKKPGVFNSRRTYTRRRRVTRAEYDQLTRNDFPPFAGKPNKPKVKMTQSPFMAGAEEESPDDEMEIEEQVDVPTKVVKTEAGYCVEWPDITSMSADEKATVFNTKMTGLSTAIAGGVAQLIGEHKILTEYGMDDEEADAALEEGAAAAEEQMGMDQEMMDEHGFKPDATQAGMVDPEERDMQHEVELAKAKNPGFGPGGGAGGGFPPKGGGKPPFPPKPGKPPAFNSATEDEEFINNWCNQYGGDTCKDPAKNEATKERLKAAKGKAKSLDKEKVKGKAKGKVSERRTSKKIDKLDSLAEALSGGTSKEDKNATEFGKSLAQASKELKDARKASKDKEHAGKSIFRKAWDFVIGNNDITGNADAEDEIGDAIADLVETAEEQLGRDLTDDEIDQLVEEFITTNAFCATGEGGGVDPSCPPTGMDRFAKPGGGHFSADDIDKMSKKDLKTLVDKQHEDAQFALSSLSDKGKRESLKQTLGMHERRQAITKTPEQTKPDIKDVLKGFGEGRRIHIADVRDKLEKTHPHAQVSSVLKELSRDGEITMYPLDDPRQINQRHEEAAVHSSTGQPQHILYYGGTHS